jgi:hypothetical protein
MAIVKKISELTPKGSALGNTDLLIVGVNNGTDYDLKSVTGAQLLGTVVSQTITDGITSKSPSEDAVFEKLKEYDSLSSSQNTSTAIRFDKKFIHADTDISGKFIGLTGNITVQTGVGTLNVNTQSLLIHNHSSIPTFSSEFIKAQDSLDYKINVDNYVICTLINQNPFKVSYRIVRDTNDLRLITTDEGTVLSNTSGTNTGDETVTTIKTKLGITTLSGSNTGDQDLSTLLFKANNLSDLTNTTTARTNLGLGSLATQSGTFSGTSSGTNTGDQDLSTYQPYTTATTGSVISFIVPQVYNSVASPSSSNITDSLTSAKIGIVQKIYHNHTVAPTFPAGWVKMGTATYTTSTLNVIFAEWVSSTRVEYWITKPS